MRETIFSCTDKIANRRLAPATILSCNFEGHYFIRRHHVERLGMKRREGRSLCLSCQIQKVGENDGECSSIRT